MKQEKGYVLISVIIAVSLVLLTLLVASTYTQLGSRLLMLQLNYQGQALNTAQAGLVEAADWFRRQAVQPVTVFSPVHNLTLNPPINDTDVPTSCVAPACTQTNPVSIQRDFLISAPGNVWGHYEVVVGNTATGRGVLDLTQARRGAAAAAGAIWQLESTGVIYVRNDTTGGVAYNQSPNQVLATKTVRSEIQKIAMRLPDTAAMSINSAASASVNIGAGGNQCRVIGGTSGRGVASTNNSSPTVAGGATLSGNPAYGVAGGSFALTTVFGVSNQTDLATIADINVTSVASLPNPLPSMQLILLNVGAGTAVFNAARPLVGSGILIVFGNLQVGGGASAPSSWDGVIYVTGTYRQTDPSTINGTVVVAGNNATVDGTGNFSEIFWDPFMFNQIQQQLSQYRFSRSGYVPCPSWDTNCNSRFAGSL
ncbi:MAG: hypothetical protein M3041_10090 [Acidobacteriota bacterium]|nr:hypothetical protein [Acidobacteriota bacterium]